jgi:hypothetical protein
MDSWRKTASESRIERVSGLSTMDFYWDAKAGSPKKTRLVEEVQYRFHGTILIAVHPDHERRLSDRNRHRAQEK